MRKTAVAAGGAALAIALAGCGGGTSGEAAPLYGSAQELVMAASAETSQAKTVRVTMEMSLGGERRTAHGRMRFAGKETAMALTMETDNGTMKMRYIDQVVYFRAPEQMSTKLSTSEPWVKIDLNGDGFLVSIIGPIIKRSLNSADPTKLLQRIENAGTITRKERTETGSHYWIRIDVVEMIRQGYPSIPQSVLEKGGKDFQGVTIPMQVWLNNDARPTKIKVDLGKIADVMSGSESTTSGGTVVVKYSDWGAPVEIEAPPESKVGTFEMPDLGDLLSPPN